MHSEPSDTDICFAIRQAARQVSRFYERYLSQVGLTPSQFCILRSLEPEAGATMVELARATSTDRTTLVRALKPLLREALVEQALDRGRRQRIALTQAGRRRLDEAMRCWRIAQAAFERHVGPRHTAALCRELASVSRDLMPDGAPA